MVHGDGRDPDAVTAAVTGADAVIAILAAPLRRGHITLPPSHARRLLVEAARHYRRAPAKGQTLRGRQVGQPAHIIEIAWQALRRRYRVWQRLDTQRGKRRTIVAVAVARELAGFCWALANAD